MRYMRASLRAASVVVSALLAVPFAVAADTPRSGSCNLGNGITHVIHITFDNVQPSISKVCSPSTT